MENREVARILRETAQLLEIDGAIIGRYRSYEKAAELIASLTESVEELAHDPKKLIELPGIGERPGRAHSGNPQNRRLQPARKTAEEISRARFSSSSICNRSGPRRSRFLWSTFKAATVEDVEKLAREAKAARPARLRRKKRRKHSQSHRSVQENDRPLSDRFAEQRSRASWSTTSPSFGKLGRLGHSGRLAAPRQGNHRRPRPAGHPRARHAKLRRKIEALAQHILAYTGDRAGARARRKQAQLPPRQQSASGRAPARTRKATAPR